MYMTAKYDATNSRRHLERIWNFEKPKVYIIMNRASTATHDTDDSTTKRLTNTFTRNFEQKYGGFVLINIDDHEYNIKNTISSMNRNDTLVYAWGCSQHTTNVDKMKRIIADMRIQNVPRGRSFQINTNGSPGFPRNALDTLVDYPIEA